MQRRTGSSHRVSTTHYLDYISKGLTVGLLPVESTADVRVIGSEYDGTHELWVLITGHTGVVEYIGQDNVGKVVDIRQRSHAELRLLGGRWVEKGDVDIQVNRELA